MSPASPAPQYPWLVGEIGNGSVVVTASRRLARDLSGSYAAQMIVAGKSAWRTPQVFYWFDWLSRLLANAADPLATPRRLDGLSSTVLWEQSLRQRVPEGVLNFGGVVRQSMQAWQRLNEWDIPLPAVLAAASTADEQLFAGAAADYADQLSKNNWVDVSGMPAVVAELINAEPSLTPKRVVFAGFDQQSPSVRRVTQSLDNAGCNVVVQKAADRTSDVEILAYENDAAELRAAGAWARKKLTENPEESIAIVCPSLEADAEEAARLVREGLVPGWQYGAMAHRAAANISYGRRLADYPAIAVALLLLRWVSRGLRGPEISVLLRTHCLGPAEFGGRSRLELALRMHPDRDWTAANFKAALTGVDQSADAQSFLALVEAIDSLSGDVAEKRFAPTDCVRQIDGLLELAGWPGSSSLGSAEFQLVNRWRELLNDFARVESVIPSTTWSDAINRIAALAAETVWQAESEAGSVQVLGTLEAFGMEFDRMWVCGLDASQWPPPSRPTPFVSRALQRDREMPDSTPANTLAFARRLLASLAGASPDCVLSWSQSRQDAELTISTLLDAVVPTIDRGAADIRAADPGWAACSLVDSGKTESINADPAPPVATGEQVRGGAYTVQRQYTDPFSAFVHGRLGVRLPEAFVTGLSPGVRGNIIHNALHNLLDDLPAQADLSGWTMEELDRRVGSAIDSALERHGRHADPVLRSLLGLERARLRRLLQAFVAAEGERPEFKVVAVEKDVEYQHAGVTLGFRIDRIDRLADGRLLVIDYKTGAPKSFLTQNGELRDLQLVVYADAMTDSVGGILFINIDSRDIGLRGAGDGWSESFDPEWPNTLASWQQEVRDVVAELAAGDVRVDIGINAGAGRSLSILSRLEEHKRARQ